MKKIATLVIALTLILCAALPAYAETITQDSTEKTQNVEISVSIAPTYTVTIPANTTITFESETTSLGNLELTNARLHPKFAVSVKVSTSELVNSSDSDVKIPYTVNAGSTPISSGSSVIFTETVKSYALSLEITDEAWAAAPAGEYAGTLTFEVSYAQVD